MILFFTPKFAKNDCPYLPDSPCNAVLGLSCSPLWNLAKKLASDDHGMFHNSPKTLHGNFTKMVEEANMDDPTASTSDPIHATEKNTIGLFITHGEKSGIGGVGEKTSPQHHHLPSRNEILMSRPTISKDWQSRKTEKIAVVLPRAAATATATSHHPAPVTSYRDARSIVLGSKFAHATRILTLHNSWQA